MTIDTSVKTGDTFFSDDLDLYYSVHPTCILVSGRSDAPVVSVLDRDDMENLIIAGRVQRGNHA